MWFSRILRPIYINEHVLTMVNHGQNTVNLGHGQTVAYG